MGRAENRVAVIELHRHGAATSQIARQLGLHRSTVFRIVRRYRELGTAGERPRSGRPRNVRTPRLRRLVGTRLNRNPRRSMRRLAAELDVSRESMRRLVTQDLDRRPYRLRRGHYLDDRMKANRLTCARKLRRLTAAGRVDRVMFTDEKVFTVQPVRNGQNDRQLLPRGTRRDVTVQRSHFPQSIMVWAGVTASGKTPLVFVPRGIKLNAAFYQEHVLPLAADWGRRHFGPDVDWVFQQDWAPAHGARSTLAMCADVFPTFWGKTTWPSNSPDLNPLDYGIWGILEQRVGRTRHATVEALRSALERAWDEIPEGTIACTVRGLVKRLDACIAAGGGHFEHDL